MRNANITKYISACCFDKVFGYNQSMGVAYLTMQLRQRWHDKEVTCITRAALAGLAFGALRTRVTARFKGDATRESEPFVSYVTSDGYPRPNQPFLANCEGRRASMIVDHPTFWVSIEHGPNNAFSEGRADELGHTRLGHRITLHRTGHAKRFRNRSCCLGTKSDIPTYYKTLQPQHTYLCKHNTLSQWPNIRYSAHIV